jgi:hypothetical protein
MLQIITMSNEDQLTGLLWKDHVGSSNLFYMNRPHCCNLIRDWLQIAKRTNYHGD